MLPAYEQQWEGDILFLSISLFPCIPPGEGAHTFIFCEMKRRPRQHWTHDHDTCQVFCTAGKSLLIFPLHSILRLYSLF